MTGTRQGSAITAVGRFLAEFKRDGGIARAAAVAYYSLFALAPMLVLAISGAQRLLSREQVVRALQGVVTDLAGSELAAEITDIVRSSAASRYDTTVNVVGGVLLIWTLVVAYGHLHDAFNAMWGVRSRPGAPLSERVRYQGPRLALALLPASILVLVTLASSALVAVAHRFDLDVLDTAVTTLGSPLIMAGATWVALVLLYRFVPDVRLRFGSVVLPAAAVAIAWSVGTYLYGRYLSSVGMSSASGAAGAVFLLLVWMNYTARAVLMGCRWCRLNTEKSGAVVPLAHAELVDTRPPAALTDPPPPN